MKNKKQTTCIVFGLIGALVLVCGVVGLLVLSLQGDNSQSLDDALTLMVASQTRLYDQDTPVSHVRLPGHAQLAISYAAQTPAEINEHKMLADTYLKFANTLDSNDSMRAEFEKKALYHQSQVNILARARAQAYRRGKGFQLFVRRRILRPIGKIGGAVFNGIDKVGRVTFILVRDEVVFRAKEIVRIKLQELKNLAQGKIDLAWNRLAGKIGGLPTEILRRFVIDPAFVAWRDQNLKRFAGKSGNAAGQTENEEEDDDYNPDAEGLNEEGETGYDDEDQPQTLTGNQIYDVKNWFPEENSYDVCMALGGDFAEYPVHDRDIWRYFSTGYGDQYYMDITCDFRRVPDLHRGFEISIEAYQKDEEIIHSSDVDYLSHYCVEDPAAFTWGEHTCQGSDYMLEERMCNDVSCNTRLTFLDQNVATFIMIEHAPGTSAVAEIEAIAEHLRQIYAEKRSITTTR